MKQYEKYLFGGLLLIGAGVLSDSLFRASNAVILPLTTVGALSTFYALRLQKRAKQQGAMTPVADQPVSKRAKRMVILLFSFALGSILGFFLMRHDFPRQSVAFHVCTAVSIFLFGTVISYRQLFPKQISTHSDQIPK